MTYQALVTDLDSTVIELSSDGHDISDRTHAAIQRAIDASKYVGVATGRIEELAIPVFRRLGIISPCIVDGGTKVIDPTSGETLWEKSMDLATTRRVFELVRAETDLGYIMTSSDTNEVETTQAQTPTSPLRALFLLAIPATEAARIDSIVNQTVYAVSHITPSWHGLGKLDLHITHPEATKEHALQVWQELVGVSTEQTIVMGDSGNDLPLSASAGLRIAVANATPELKAQADYIAPAYDQEALTHVIDTRLLA